MGKKYQTPPMVLLVLVTSLATACSGTQAVDQIPGADEHRGLVVPAGTRLEIELETTVASNANLPEDPVRATLLSPLVVDDVTVAPAGTALLGHVIAAKASGDVKGRARLGIRFDRLQVGPITHEIRTRPLHYAAEGTKKEDALKIGLGAAAGAVIGGLAGGGKGAAVGSAIGGGVGTANVLTTPGEDVRVGAGTRLRIELVDDATLEMPKRAS